MDKKLRILQRQAAAQPNDLSAQHEYIRALERASGANLTSSDPVEVWVVFPRHVGTSGDDVRVFTTEVAAKRDAMSQMLLDITTAHREGGCTLGDLDIAQAFFDANNFEQLSQHYFVLTGQGNEFLFIITKQEVRD